MNFNMKKVSVRLKRISDKKTNFNMKKVSVRLKRLSDKDIRKSGVSLNHHTGKRYMHPDSSQLEKHQFIEEYDQAITSIGSNITQHKTMHQGTSNGINDGSNIYRQNNVHLNISCEDYLKSKGFIQSTFMDEFNDENCEPEKYNESEVGKKRIKVEPVDIDHENKVEENDKGNDVKVEPMDIDHENKVEENDKGNDVKVEPVDIDHENNVEENDKGNDVQEPLCNKDFLQSETEHIYASDGIQLDYGINNTGILTPRNIKTQYMSRVEVDVDNTGIYIPDGWQRKVFQSKINNRYFVNYFNPDGKRFSKKIDLDTHISLSRNSVYANSVDVDKIDFSITSHPNLRKKRKRKTSHPNLRKERNVEVDVDNTGIYIPDGWQRKVFQSKINNRYVVNYFNPDGKRFNKKIYLDTHISLSRNSVYANSVDIDKIDFSITSHPNLSKKRKRKETQGYDKHLNCLIEYRKVFNWVALNLCKICNYSCQKKKDAYQHANTHIQNLDNQLSFNSFAKNYDYFVCTICHIRLKGRDDSQIHMQGHNIKQLSDTVVAVKSVIVFESKDTILLHCCEVCNFASTKYLKIVKHLNDHTLDEVDAADEAKYQSCQSNESWESDRNIKALTKEEDASVNEHSNSQEGQIDNEDCQNKLFSKWHNGGIIYSRELQNKVEIDVDNTGKYIPDGWQRKVYKYTKGTQRGVYHVDYISPFGSFLDSKKVVSKYIKSLEREGIALLVDIDNMDFSPISQVPKKVKTRIAKRTKQEVKVDHTGVYIPEGWQRKLYRYIEGTNKGRLYLFYVSPLKKEVHSKKIMIEYLKSLEEMGTVLLVDVERLDFSIKPYL